MDKQLEKNLKQLENADIAWQLNRVANALEEVLRLVKRDLEAADAYRRQQDEKN